MTKINEITPIQKSRNLVVSTRNKLEILVETPLLPACQKLYDLNIRTLSTSANRKDIGQGAYIIIDYDALSPENQKIANEISEVNNYDGGKAVDIRIPINVDTEEKEVQNIALQLASRFRYQKMTWAPKYTFGHVLKMFGVRDRNQFTPKEIEDQTGMFYDSQTDTFYLSLEHFQKVNSDSQKNKNLSLTLG